MSIMNRENRKRSHKRIKSNLRRIYNESNQTSITNLYVVWLMHFGDTEPGKETCLDCSDYEMKVCAGKDLKGEQCLDCMEKIIQNSIIINSN